MVFKIQMLNILCARRERVNVQFCVFRVFVCVCKSRILVTKAAGCGLEQSLETGLTSRSRYRACGLGRNENTTLAQEPVRFRPFVFYTFFVEFYNFGSEKFYKKNVEFLRRAIFSTISVEIVEIL